MILAAVAHIFRAWKEPHRQGQLTSDPSKITDSIRFPRLFKIQSELLFYKLVQLKALLFRHCAPIYLFGTSSAACNLWI
jgi:hypothetical protein